MAELDFATVVIEGDWHTLLRNPPRWTQMKPKAFYASVLAWQRGVGGLVDGAWTTVESILTSERFRLVGPPHRQ